MPDRPPLILVVMEDNPVRNFLAALLMQADYRVMQAATGCRGLAEFTVHKPDALVFDLTQPDVAGTEIIRQIRERSSVPILAVATPGPFGDNCAWRQTGANDVITKPIQVDAVLSCAHRESHEMPWLQSAAKR